MRALEFDTVEAASDAVPGHCGVSIDDLGNFVELDGFGDLAEQRVRHGARCPHRQPRVHRRGLSAVVIDLGQDRHAVDMDGIGDLAVAVDHVGVEAMDELLVGPVRRVGGVLLGDDEPGPAGRPGRGVGGVLVGGPTIGGVVRQVRGEDDAVGHRHRSDAQRTEEMLVGTGCAHGVDLTRPILIGPMPRRRRSW